MKTLMRAIAAATLSASAIFTAAAKADAVPELENYVSIGNRTSPSACTSDKHSVYTFITPMILKSQKTGDEQNSLVEEFLDGLKAVFAESFSHYSSADFSYNSPRDPVGDTFTRIDEFVAKFQKGHGGIKLTYISGQLNISSEPSSYCATLKI